MSGSKLIPNFSLSQKDDLKYASELNTLDKNITFESLKNNPSKFYDFFYTLPSIAIDEIKHRKKTTDCFFLDKETKTDTENILGFIHRDITPSIEINRMISVCDVLDLQPIFFENPSDKFSCLSRSKYLLAKMSFFSGYDKNNKPRIDYLKIIDFTKKEGRPLEKIITNFGKSITDFHRDLFKEHYNINPKYFFDIAKFSIENKAIEVYKYLFSLTISDGILLENFLLPTEEEFIENVIFPAYKEIWEKYGKKPLIVPMEPLDLNDHDFSLYYPSVILDKIKVKYNL